MSARWSAEPGTLVDRKARAGDLGATRVVDDVERLADLPVRLAAPRRAASACVGPDLTVPRLLGGELLAPRPDRDVRLLATDRDIRVGGVRDAQELLLEVLLDLGEGRVELLDLLAGLGGRPLELRHLRTVGRGAGLDRRADLLRCVVALRLERLGLGQQPSPLGVQLERAIDERRVLALVDRALANDVGLLAEPGKADAHAVAPSIAASRRRVATKSGSSDASSQPARGPLVRPRNAR